MQIGSLGAGGLAMGDLMRLQAEGKTTAGAKDDSAVIFVWLPGGPPHMEMYDLKPNAPSEYRGEFRPIATNIAGINVGELLPLHAKCADKYTLIRSVAHEFADHGGGHKRFLTGRDPREPSGFVNDYPAVPSIIAKMREKRKVGVPNYVAGMDNGRQGIDVFSFGSAYLGTSTYPFVVPGDPSSPDFKIQNLGVLQGLEARLDDRMTLLNGLDRVKRTMDRSGMMDSMDEFHRRAFDLVTSEKARQAFDLSREPSLVRERYGNTAWGMRALMARRLVEAGVSFVTMVMENPCPGKPFPDGVLYNWDSHAVNGHLFDDARFRLPIYDQAITALVEDIYARGLDRRVLLVVTGEFGRTPRISHANGRPGRDHWPQAMSMLLAGGGMKTGQVIGATSSKGEYPVDRRLSPNDLWASVYRHLGIDYNNSFPDHAGRPMPILPYGDPIAELLPVG